MDTSVLGSAAIVDGRIDCDGEIHVHGRILGRVSAERILVGEAGIVKGDIVARHIRIFGRFSGRIFAVEVALEPSARIEGKIFHHLVTVARGARIDGRMPWRPLAYFDSLDQLPEIQP
jgi:cytoskeletal protein CcmA (bactofilin family)